MEICGTGGIPPESEKIGTLRRFSQQTVPRHSPGLVDKQGRVVDGGHKFYDTIDGSGERPSNYDEQASLERISSIGGL